MQNEKRNTKIISAFIILIAWLIAIAIIYIVFLKIKLFFETSSLYLFHINGAWCRVIDLANKK